MARLSTVQRHITKAANLDTLVGCVLTINADPSCRGYHVAVLDRVDVPMVAPPTQGADPHAFTKCVIMDQLGQVIPANQGGASNNSVRELAQLLKDVFTENVVINEHYEPREMAGFTLRLDRNTQFKCYYSRQARGPVHLRSPLGVQVKDGIVSVPIRHPEFRRYANGDCWELSYYWPDIGNDEAVLARVIPAFILSVLKVGEFRRTVFLHVEVGTFSGGQGYLLSINTENVLESDEWRRAEPVEYNR